MTPAPLARRGRAVATVLVALVALAVALPALGAEAAGAASGVDVSNWQHPNGAPIDWGAVRASGRTFTFIKATGGPDYRNPYFAGDWAGSGAAGMYRGAYHYAQPAPGLQTAVAQARWFVATTGTMQGRADLPPVLDLETTNGLGPADLVAWTQTWLGEVQRLTGRTPMLYVGYYFWQDALGSSGALAGYRLWLPWWTPDPLVVRIPPPWGTWTFWQSSNSGSVPGIPATVDLDQYCCADANLAALGGGSGSPAAGNPFGSLDQAYHHVYGGIDVGGWAIDPDTTGPVTVHLYVDGVGAAITTTGTARPDVAGAYPGWGADHGFAATVPAGPGPHTVCAWAINSAVGTSNTMLGCRFVANTPVGSLDSATVTPAGIRLTGWALSPDTTASVFVDVYRNGAGAARVLASGPRPDIAGVWSGYGPAHGFDVTVPGRSGTVCAYAIAPGGGPNPVLGCAAVSNRPLGHLDSATVTPQGIRLTGWAASPSHATPVYVDVYRNGAGAAHVLASGPRPDVGAAFPANGPNHGFDVTVPGASGVVCVYAIDPDGGPNPVIGCAWLTGSPVGSLDLVARTGGTTRVGGWALSPSTAAPIFVDVYRNGVGIAHLLASGVRSDIAAAFPANGAAHGFDVTVGGVGGTVCAYAIDPGGGPNPLIGCRPG